MTGFIQKNFPENSVLNIYLPAGYNQNDTVKYPDIYLLDGSADEDFTHIVGVGKGGKGVFRLFALRKSWYHHARSGIKFIPTFISGFDKILGIPLTLRTYTWENVGFLGRFSQR